MPLMVNGQTIDDAVIEQEFSAIKAHYESLGSISCCERDDEFRGYARDNITFRALLTQEAQRTIPEPDAEEVAQAFDKLKEEHGGGDRFYASMGLSPEQDELIQRDLSMNLQVESLRDNACQTLPAPTEADCRAYYDGNLGQFSDEDEVRASHIFKSVRETEKREGIFKALCEVRQRLVDGADFTELAREHSDKPAEEIDLGYFKRGELMDEFEIVAFSMKEGEVSPVFTTQHGFHLAKVTGRKAGEPKPFESVRAGIEAELTAQRQDAKLQELVDALKKTAKIEYIEPEEGLGDHDHD
ncbi:MAG: peptidyl-prolyl cis-trans isomerase [Verrucomicrobia bacterium]|nr:peptidyl-prolyl cis-trans isomerase [Verrucomicrobiota bacterium]